ncbi:N4-gp56 family major capsid protein [Alkalihalophilus pseudofirmus]|uniref:N4-gp56 family major capsid protein n=1 Tax=Alkalihalophilus pseudofirmus TaxID=79885 RepID=A0AAJ2KZX4_ALKPS|nr:N4-gp56 family major capsid protein [Alkalihalophilus pseudofirmus]MDV2883830.1 N4-gp56 family major capsid protein [Alkalihalophilus pseudofirmus]OLS34448.1 N4-gp56 family major capsid protein [Alkalihalophilus pseudofirmus]
MKKPKFFLKLNIQHFAQTKAADLVNPEVMADAISAQLPEAIRFLPYARTDNTLVGQPGDTITRPRYAYIGPAEDLEEGVPMDPEKLSMTTTKVTIKEAGKAVEVTERAILTNVNGTVGEAEKQIKLSMADKIDIDYVSTLREATLSFNGLPTTPAAIIDAVDVFDDEDTGDYILFINNKDYTKLVKSLFSVGGETQNQALTKAQVSELVGVKDIVKTKRLNEGEAYLQKQGAVEIVWKKQPDVQSDGDILARTVVIAGNQYYTTNLYDESGVVKLTETAEE